MHEKGVDRNEDTTFNYVLQSGQGRVLVQQSVYQHTPEDRDQKASKGKDLHLIFRRREAIFLV